MWEWLDPIISGKVTAFGGVAIAIAAAMVLLLRFLLPAKDRARLRTPVVMLLLHIILVLIRVLVPPEAVAQDWLRSAALFLVLASIANSSFLLVMDWLMSLRLKRTIPKIFRDIIAIVVYIVVSIITLRAVGVDPGSILTTSALLTAAIALSLQDTLGNLFAGIALEAQRPFVKGDWIQFDEDPDHIGRITEMNWRATKVLTNDGVEIIIPNGALAKISIVNFTQPTPVSRRKIVVRAPLDVPPRRVEETILKALDGIRQVLDVPAPMVLVGQFGESSMEYHVYVYIDDFEARLRIESKVRSRVWYSLTRAGIDIPPHVLDVRSHDATREAVSHRKAMIALREHDIRQVNFLNALEDEAIKDLAELTEIRLFTAGEPIITQSEDGDELFVVRSGEVSVVLEKKHRGGEVARLGPGKFFGEMSLMTGEKRSATVLAATECELLVIGHAAFKSILLAHPEAAENVGKALSSRQVELDERTSNMPSSVEPSLEEGEGALLVKIKSFFKL